MPIFSSVFFTRVLSGLEDVFGSESADPLGTSGSWFSSSASSWGAGAGGTLTLQSKHKVQKHIGSQDKDYLPGCMGFQTHCHGTRQVTQVNGL